MCGFAGVLVPPSAHDLRDRLPDVLGRMLGALRHRGPDGEGTAVISLDGGGALGLTHARLAIMDCSDAGRQPMADPVTGNVVAYNGEIYNHAELRRRRPDLSFATGCDTEWLLKAWAGPEGLADARGMFAFALYDKPNRSLWLVRDRLGVKPLYAAELDGGGWAFASEVRALLASGLVARRLSRRAIGGYLALGAVPSPWTIVEGVVGLWPGEAWQFDLAGPPPWEPEQQLYWEPEFPERGEKTPSRGEALEALRPVLREAVRLRMVSDVPTGVFLSGGIDSTGVVASLVAQGVTPRTLSVVFDEEGYSEGEVAAATARGLGVPHQTVRVPAGEVVRDWAAAVAAYDQPSIDGINTWVVSRAARGAGLTVALSGLGGDELFGGYPYFRTLRAMARPGAVLAAWAAAGVLRRLRAQDRRLTKLAALGRAGGKFERYLACRQVVAADRRRALLGDDLPPLPDDFGPMTGAVERLDAVNAAAACELAVYLPEMLLRDTDQMSMAHALEVREPLLDHLLVETAAKVSGRERLRHVPGHGNKALLTEALPPLPDAVRLGRKRGFVFPWAEWLRGPLRAAVQEVLFDETLAKRCGLNRLAVRRVAEEFYAGRGGVRAADVLALTHLMDWARRHEVFV